MAEKVPDHSITMHQGAGVFRHTHTGWGFIVCGPVLVYNLAGIAEVQLLDDKMLFFEFFQCITHGSWGKVCFLHEILWVIAPPASSISITVFDEGGNVVEYMMIVLTLLTYESIGNLNEPPQYSIMFERQERVAILLLLGVACAVITAHLILGTLGKQPFARPFTNNSADGELVIVGGTIDQITITKNGGHMNVYLANITIFVPVRLHRN